MSSETLIRFCFDKDHVIDFPNNSCIKVALFGVCVSQFWCSDFWQQQQHAFHIPNQLHKVSLALLQWKRSWYHMKCVFYFCFVSKRNKDNGNENTTFLYILLLSFGYDSICVRPKNYSHLLCRRSHCLCC